MNEELIDYEEPKKQEITKKTIRLIEHFCFGKRLETIENIETSTHEDTLNQLRKIMEERKKNKK